MTTVPARERILDSAARLFIRDGYRATGIDKIIAESGVAKMSLYRHFASKNALIAAFLEQRHASWMAWFEGEVDARLAAGGGLEAIADALQSWFEGGSFRGCAFINIVTEGGVDADPQLNAHANAHKLALADYLASVARRLALARPEQVADEVLLCIEGMIVRYQMTADARVVDTGRRCLRRLQRDQ